MLTEHPLDESPQFRERTPGTRTLTWALHIERISIPALTIPMRNSGIMDRMLDQALRILGVIALALAIVLMVFMLIFGIDVYTGWNELGDTISNMDTDFSNMGDDPTSPDRTQEFQWEGTLTPGP